jgi:hypothetical protein
MNLYRISINGKRPVRAVQNGEILPDTISWAIDPPGIAEIVGTGAQVEVVSVAPGRAIVTQRCVNTDGVELSDSDEVEVYLLAATETDMIWGDEVPK